jgi:hypothetical protein
MIYSEMYKNIIDTLKDAGINLNTPQQITFENFDSEYEKSRPRIP